MNARRGQSGQALAELTIALVGILAIFCGFLLISKLGIQNVDNIVRTRGIADDNAINSTVSNPGYPILAWDNGADNILYTADDTRMEGVFADPTLFSGEMQNGSFNMRTDLTMPYIRENYATYVGNPDFIFINAAELTSGTASSSVQLDDIERLLYVNTDRISVRDESFMPFTDHSL